MYVSNATLTLPDAKRMFVNNVTLCIIDYGI